MTSRPFRFPSSWPPACSCSATASVFVPGAREGETSCALGMTLQGQVDITDRYDREKKFDHTHQPTHSYRSRKRSPHIRPADLSISQRLLQPALSGPTPPFVSPSFVPGSACKGVFRSRLLFWRFITSQSRARQGLKHFSFPSGRSRQSGHTLSANLPSLVPPS